MIEIFCTDPGRKFDILDFILHVIRLVSVHKQLSEQNLVIGNQLIQLTKVVPLLYSSLMSSVIVFPYEPGMR